MTDKWLFIANSELLFEELEYPKRKSSRWQNSFGKNILFLSLFGLWLIIYFLSENHWNLFTNMLLQLGIALCFLSVLYRHRSQKNSLKFTWRSHASPRTSMNSHITMCPPSTTAASSNIIVPPVRHHSCFLLQCLAPELFGRISSFDSRKILRK